MDVNFFKWLLEVDIRAKNAASMLVALLAVVAVYFILFARSWFQAMPPWGQAASFVIVFLISFLFVWLLWSGVHAVCDWRAQRKQVILADVQSDRRIRQALESLTSWQRSFLLRFVIEDRTQIPEWQVGGYRALWDADMDVLQRKGIIISHMGGMYEIRPEYLTYLREHWDPESGRLS